MEIKNTKRNTWSIYYIKCYICKGIYSKTSNKQSETSFFLSPISPEDVKALISTLKVHKAIRPDSIPTIIKKLLLKPLTNLINLSFLTGLFPKILKQAKIIPMFKKGDQQDYNNYRPILLLSNISQIIEKLVHRQLYGFLEFNKFLYTNQFGFCNLHSTNYVLITITEKIRKAIDNGEITCGVFLDLQKAFDTVDHEILLSKPEHYGICGVPVKWFKTFLTQQHHYVSIKNPISETLTNDHGVPQGSGLGPLLFLIYINDLHQVTKHTEIHHFVDDTNLLYSSKSHKDINQKINFELKNIAHWPRANKISLNTKKTEIALFRAQKTIIRKNKNVLISGQKINIMKETKYFGMVMNEHLVY